MEFEQILKLIDAVSASGLSGLELEENGMRLRMTSGNPEVLFRPSFVPAAEKTEDLPDRPLETSVASPEAEKPEQEGQLVKAPLVGTFYSAPAEGEDAFVRPGDRVKKGQILGIIEAMKLMNEIECEFDGVLDAVLVENEQVVEYGQPLFRIRREG